MERGWQAAALFFLISWRRFRKRSRPLAGGKNFP
jgi:hypothetical protein